MKIAIGGRGPNGLGTCYVDAYDHWFDAPWDPEAIIWPRNHRFDFPSRTESFLQMQAKGIPVVPWASARVLHEIYPGEKLVVYTDETLHQGYGKELLNGTEASLKYPNALASLYIRPVVEGVSVSRRCLLLGSRSFTIQYESKDWKSNHDTTDIKLIDEPFPAGMFASLCDLMKVFVTPIIAVDSVPTVDGRWLATDLNLAPGTRGTPIWDVITHKEAATLIKATYQFLIAQDRSPE